jgi:galactofuranose transport system substrate-binding protein
VDIIGISPIVETGWEEVFQQARDAGIPIILVDRRADVPEDLYVSYLGSDFLEEGRNAARIMADLVDGKGEYRRTGGNHRLCPANDRYTGFREILEDYPGMTIIDSQSGDFTRARGKEVMAAFLQNTAKYHGGLCS